MTRYKYILIDADGTLFDYHKAERESLNNTFNYYGIINKDSVYSDLYKKINSQCWKDFEHGLLSLEELRLKRFKTFIEMGKLGDIDPLEMGQKYLGFLSLSGYMLEGAVELLESLYKNHSVSMITNGIKEIQHSRIDEAGIRKYFDNIVISDEIGYQKPAGEYFDIAMERIGNPEKSDVLVIGDSLSSDIAGGNRYGLDTCWINFENSPTVCPGNKKLPDSLSALEGDLKPVYEVSALNQILDIVS